MPTCPPGYNCTFNHVKIPFHGPWWEGPWGIALAVLVVIAITAILITIAYYIQQSKVVTASNRERAQIRANQLAIEEQRTMQLDAAKGNPDMIKIVRDLQR